MEKCVDSIIIFILDHFVLNRIRQKCYQKKRYGKNDTNGIISFMDIDAASTWTICAYTSYPEFFAWVTIGVLFKANPDISFIYLLLVLAIPTIIYYPKLDIAVLKNKRYLEYFKEFEKEDEKWHKKWKRIAKIFRFGGALVTILGVVIIFMINGMISLW